MPLDMKLMEPGAALVKTADFNEIARISQAISLRRIADALEAAPPFKNSPVPTYGWTETGVKDGKFYPAKQTSPEVSSLAAKYLAMSNDELLSHIAPGKLAERQIVVTDIKKLAASCLSQDESKG